MGGVRVDGSGRPLRVELMTTAGDRTRELVQQVLQSQWKAAGIDVRIRNQPARVFFGETVSRRRFAAMALFAWFSAPESVPRTTLHSSEIPTEANGWSGQNYPGFRNAEMDATIEAIETELDEGKRRALWARLQAIYADAAAGAAAVVARQSVRPARLAGRGAPDRPPVPDDAVGRGVAGTLKEPGGAMPVVDTGATTNRAAGGEAAAASTSMRDRIRQ